MKILFWGPYTSPVGTIRAQINSALALKRYGDHEVALIRAHSEWRESEDELRKLGIPVLDLGLSRLVPGAWVRRVLHGRLYMILAGLLGFARLRRLLNRERPDALVTSLVAAPAILAAASVRPRPRIIASVQGYPQFLGGMPGAGAKPLWKRIEDALRRRLWMAIYPLADAVVCLSEETAGKLRAQTSIPPHKIRVVPNPVLGDDVLLRAKEPLAHPWYRDPPHHPVIVGVGRLTRQKDFATLLRALARVRRRLDARLVILGEGEDRPALEALARELGVADHVDLAGHQANPFPYVARADLFVLSSLWEDPGHAIIEAAALGTPIVTTDCPSGPLELIEHGQAGWFCKAGDPDGMAQAIVEALEHPDPRRVERARRNANRFGLQLHFEALSAILLK